MGNGLERGLSINQTKKMAGQAIDRIKKLEERADQTLMIFDAVFKQVGQKISQLDEKVNALIKLVGEEAVNEEIQRGRTALLEAKAEMSKAALQQMVTNGIATKVDKVEIPADQAALPLAEQTKKPLLILREEKDGKVQPPGYAAMFYQQLNEKGQAAMLGQSPGFSFKSDEGADIVLLEVYIVDQDAERKFMAEMQAKAQAAAAEGAAAEAEAETNDEATDITPPTDEGSEGQG